MSATNDWLDDAADVATATTVDVQWTAKAADGTILHSSDCQLTGAQAEAMFRGIASVETN